MCSLKAPADKAGAFLYMSHRWGQFTKRASGYGGKA